MIQLSYQIHKKDVLVAFIILILALSLRAEYFKDYQNTDAYPLMQYSDGYSYFLWAKDISSGDVWGSKAFMKWPLYAYFLGILFKVFGSNVNIVYALQFVLGAVNCVLIYFIARIIFNRTVAIIAGLFCLFYGLFIFYDSLLIYTSLSLFLNSLFFLFLLQVQSNLKKSRLFWLGVFLGICTVAQANIIIFGCTAILWILWQRKSGLISSIRYFSCFIAGLSIIIGIVALRNYLVEKDFVLIQGNTGVNFYLGNNPQGQGAFTALFFTPNQDSMFRESRAIAKIELGRDIKTSQVSDFWMRKSLEFINRDFLSYLKLLSIKLDYLISPREFIHDHEYSIIKDKIRVFKVLFLNLNFILPFAFLGLLFGISRFRERALLYILIITLSLTIILFFVTTRYRIAIVPFLIIFAAFGVSILLQALQEKQFKKVGVLCLMLIFSFGLFNCNLYKRNKFFNVRPPEDFMRHFYMAQKHEEKTEYEKALKELESAQAIKPDSHYIIFSFGSVYYHMNNLKMAEVKFKEAIRIFPFYIDPYYNLGFMYNQQLRFDDAIKILNKGIWLDPEDAGLHFELGKAYKTKGEAKLAEEEFRVALRKINRWRTEERAVITKELAVLRK